MEKVFEGTMASLNDRILPHMSHPYEFWNGPLEGVRSPIFLDSFADDDGFTSIILAYERIESLYRVIEGKNLLFTRFKDYTIKELPRRLV